MLFVAVVVIFFLDINYTCIIKGQMCVSIDYDD